MGGWFQRGTHELVAWALGSVRVSGWSSSQRQAGRLREDEFVQGVVVAVVLGQQRFDRAREDDGVAVSEPRLRGLQLPSMLPSGLKGQDEGPGFGLGLAGLGWPAEQHDLLGSVDLG